MLNAVLSRKSVTPIVAANWQDRVSLRLHVNAPNTLAVRNNIADVTGSAELDVTGTLANPSIIGTVTLNEGGRVRLQNVDYTVTRGTINFQNPFRIDPYFDVTLEARVSGGLSEIESGPLDVTVIPGYASWANNGTWDGEDFIDLNGNKLWDQGEVFVDKVRIEADRFENLRPAIALLRRNAHLRHHF